MQVFVQPDYMLVIGLMLLGLSWFAHDGFVLGAPTANLRCRPRGLTRRLARRGDGPINLFALWGELWGLAMVASLPIPDVVGLAPAAAERIREGVLVGGVAVGLPILVWILIAQRGRSM